MQIVNSLPQTWKEIIKNDNGNSNNLVIQDHHLIKKNQIHCLIKLESKELYKIELSLSFQKPTSLKYFENLFHNFSFDWTRIFLLPRLVTLESRLRAFQYKILHNVLYLNKRLFKFQKVSSPLCSFCKRDEETVIHLYHACSVIKNIWLQLQSLLRGTVDVPSITPQSAIFGFLDTENTHFVIINLLLLIFKFYIYTSREQQNVSFNNLKSRIKLIKHTEKVLASNDIDDIIT